LHDEFKKKHTRGQFPQKTNKKKNEAKKKKHHITYDYYNFLPKARPFVYQVSKNLLKTIIKKI